MINAGKIGAILELDTSKWKSALSGAKLDLKNFSDSSRSIEDRIGSLSGAMTKTGGALTKNVTVPMLGVISTCTTMAATFEEKMAKIYTIADGTKVPMDTMRKSIMDLSSKTGTSTAELTESLYELYSSGVDTAEGMEYLEIANKAAIGGFTDLNTAVDGMTSVVNSYGLTGKEAFEMVGNQMIITQDLGKTTLGELSQSIGELAPIAAALGLSTAEMFSSLAATTSQGLQTNKSVTALKAAMSNIIKPTKEAADAAEILGIDFSVSAVKSKGWAGFMKDVKDKLSEASPKFTELSDKINTNTAKMTELEKAGKKGTDEYKKLSKETKGYCKDQELLVQANDSTLGGFATLFGSVEGLNGMLMLTSEQGMDVYNKSMEEMGEGSDALQKAFEKMDATEAQEFKKAINEFKLAAIELGREFLPLATDIAKVLKDWIKKFRDMRPEQKEFIAKAGLMLTALGPVLSTSGKILDIMAKVSKLKFTNMDIFKNMNFSGTGGNNSSFNMGQNAGTSAGKGFAQGFATQTATSAFATKLLPAGTATAAGTTAGTTAATSFGSSFASAIPAIAIPVSLLVAGWAIGSETKRAMTKPNISPVDLFAPKTVGDPTKGTTRDEQLTGKSYTPEVQTISESTKEIVGKYMEMDDALSKSLDLVRYKAPSVTAETFKEITGQFNTLNETIKDKINESYETEKGYMTDLLGDSKNLTEEEKTEILKTMEGTREEKLNKLTEYQDKEKEYNKMLQSDNEETQRKGLDGLLGLQQEYSGLFIENSGATAGEQALIESRMNEYRKNATAETAIEILNLAADEKEKAITAADEKYKGTINALEKSGLKEKNGELYDKLKRQAEEEHKTAVKEAEGKYEDTCKEIKEGSEDVAKEIDFSNRRIKTPWDNWKNSLGENLDWLIGKFTTLIENIQYVATHPFQSFFDFVGGGIVGTDVIPAQRGYATGTSYASRGLHMVGENGPELIAFNGGERVYNANQTKEMLSSNRAPGYQFDASIMNEMRSMRNDINNMKPAVYNNTFQSPKALNEYEIYKKMEKFETDRVLGYI